MNASIISDPRKLQGSSSATEVSNNDVFRSIAALSTKTITNLSGMTFSENYGNTVSRFGQDLALATSQLNDQQTVQKMLENSGNPSWAFPWMKKWPIWLLPACLSGLRPTALYHG